MSEHPQAKARRAFEALIRDPSNPNPQDAAFLRSYAVETRLKGESESVANLYMAIADAAEDGTL